VTAEVPLDAAPVPFAFTAATVNVCDVPFARPVTAWVNAVDENTTGACATPFTAGTTT
jgi:hypothetical protein